LTVHDYYVLISTAHRDNKDRRNYLS